MEVEQEESKEEVAPPPDENPIELDPPSEEHKEETVTEIKPRGPGRPRKHAEDDHPKKYAVVDLTRCSDTMIVNDSNSSATGSQVKRKRGRPKSTTGPKRVSLHQSSSDGTGNEVKRKRGRPKSSNGPKHKILKQNGVISGTEKRGPGRPSKSQFTVRRPVTKFAMPMKRGRGRPPGSPNKEPSKKQKWRLSLSDPLDSNPDAVILRLTGRHFPYDADEADLCRVCERGGITTKTPYQCRICMGKPLLCAAPCFELYHTEFRYWTKVKDKKAAKLESIESTESDSHSEEEDAMKEEEEVDVGQEEFSAENETESD